MTTENFASLGLPANLVRSLETAGFTTPTPIQQKAIPAQLKGRDILGIAQTGSGKTAAFSLPILTALMANEGKRTAKSVGALILAPTRELAVQIHDMIRAYVGRSHLTSALVLGGVSRHAQIVKLARGVDILVATPGRLVDLLDDKKLTLEKTEFLVLDEADRMLDMGFISAVRKIAGKCSQKRRTALFSATMPPEISKLAASLLTDPVRVESAPQGSTVTKIDQRGILTGSKLKRKVMNDLLADESFSRVIVFARTKHGADKVAKSMALDGHTVAAIHGNKSQNARQAALKGFRDGTVRLLIATDIAARGIDVPEISHVINYDLPDEPENYVHRIGRTGRNGASGFAISLIDGTQFEKLKDIERLIRQKLPLTGELPTGAAAEVPKKKGQQNQGRKNGGRRSQPGKSRARSGGGEKSGAGRPGGNGGKPGGSSRGPSKGGAAQRIAKKSRWSTSQRAANKSA